MEHNKSIAIIIPSYNGMKYLPDFLSSLSETDYPKKLLKVLIIDNNSSDGSVDYIKNNYPQIEIIRNAKNLGFTEGNNIGYVWAVDQNVDYLVLLNQDTIVDKEWLNHLVTDAQRHNVAAVQSKLMLYPETNLLNSYGNAIQFLGFGYCNNYRQLDKPGTEPFEVPYPSGAACLLKMSVLAKTGLFYSRLFMYHEDVDLGWKLRLAGYKVLLEPKSIVYHKYSFSKAKYKFYYLERNRYFVMLKNYKLATLIIFAPALIAMELGMIFFSLMNGWFKEKISGWGSLIWQLPAILRDRFKTQFKLRQVKDKEILRLFTGSIKFQDVKNPLLVYVANPIFEVYFWLAKKIIFW